jgi:hypothetical protein
VVLPEHLALTGNLLPKKVLGLLQPDTFPGMLYRTMGQCIAPLTITLLRQKMNRELVVAGQIIGAFYQELREHLVLQE